MSVRGLNKKRLEAGLWITGVFAVAVADPRAPSLIETCVFKLAGFPRCPGCGLGHAVGFLARGEFLLSFQSHPFTILVVGVLAHRVATLLRKGTDISQ